MSAGVGMLNFRTTFNMTNRFANRTLSIRLILLILSDVPVFAFDLDALGAEVDQEAHILLEGGQIVDQLNLMGLGQVLNRFQFEDDFIFNKQVSRKIAYNLDIVIDFQRLFGFSAQACFCQLDKQSFVIDAFEETEAEGVVDLVCTGDDFVG